MKNNNLFLTDVDEAQKEAMKLSFYFFRIIENKLNKNKDGFISFDLSSIAQSQRHLIIINSYNLFFHCLTMDGHLSFNAKKQLLLEQFKDIKSDFSKYKNTYPGFIKMHAEKVAEIDKEFIHNLNSVDSEKDEFWDEDFSEIEFMEHNKINSLLNISIPLSFKDLSEFTFLILKDINKSCLLFNKKTDNNLNTSISLTKSDNDLTLNTDLKLKLGMKQ